MILSRTIPCLVVEVGEKNGDREDRAPGASFKPAVWLEPVDVNGQTFVLDVSVDEARELGALLGKLVNVQLEVSL